jgi:2-keto-3-deoxy-L-rhamnonate aldolase RhmA
MNGKIIRDKLRCGDRVYGTHVVSYGNPISAKLMLALEIDFVFICTEHIPIDRTEVSTMCQFYEAHGIVPVVRIAYPSAQLAAMYIDAGAHGIVAPYVETVEQVRELIGVIRYRPIKGKFLDDIMEGSRKPKPKLQSFLERHNRNQFLVIGIESVEAMDNLEALVSPDGVDGVFLGPHDIACSMEIPEEYENPEFTKRVIDVINRCRKMGKGVGLHTDLGIKHNQQFLDAGMNWIANHADIPKMCQQMNADLGVLRAMSGDVFSRNNQKDIGSGLCVDNPRK